ncbi:hypothetical protein Taro_041669 [Colocasia esculenta]|uniref:SAGA-associated factor 11 n=1 Tax=Colocasia esculenta TaxID=4460 RepID=A0A843X0Z8_COLES|nr:hypothetical protein [Colocasia esculenta]
MFWAVTAAGFSCSSATVASSRFEIPYASSPSQELRLLLLPPFPSLLSPLPPELVWIVGDTASAPSTALGFTSFMALQLSTHFLGELLDSIIVDVASECHRIARLGLDRNLDEEEEELRLSKQARVTDPSSSSETGAKYVVDIFGQTHPAVANELFECMNCGRSVIAGRFAPHLEKCMGKGRKARAKATRSSTITQSRHSRGSPVTVYAPHSSTNINRFSNGSSGVGTDEYAEFAFEEP